MLINGRQVPPGATRFKEDFGEATVHQDRGGRLVLDSGRGNDVIAVRLADDFGVEVSVNGQAYQFSRAEARRLTVRSGNGANKIHAGPGLKAAGVRVIPTDSDQVEDLSGVCQKEGKSGDRHESPGSRRRGAH